MDLADSSNPNIKVLNMFLAVVPNFKLENSFGLLLLHFSPQSVLQIICQ